MLQRNIFLEIMFQVKRFSTTFIISRIPEIKFPGLTVLGLGDIDAALHEQRTIINLLCSDQLQERIILF